MSDEEESNMIMNTSGELVVDEEESNDIIVFGCMCGHETEPTTSHWVLHNNHPCPACGHNLNEPYQFMEITEWMKDDNDDHTECWCFSPWYIINDQIRKNDGE